MKILVADDAPVDRRVMTAFLTQARYAAEVVENGRDALARCLAFEEPYLAILDWEMPHMTGMQVCQALRATKPKIRPYVIMLSSKSEKADVAAALDAGADDYLSKPFNAGELLARLRVAERTLHYQLAQQKHIDDLEALAIRYNLLGEIVSQQSTPPWIAGVVEAASTRDAAAGTAGSGETPAADEKPGAPPPLLGADEFNACMVHVLNDLGLRVESTVSLSTAGPYAVADFTAWAGVQAVREELWFDLLLEVDRASIEVMFQRTLRRSAGSEAELCGMLAETHTLFSAAIKAAMATKGGVVLTPMFTRSLRTDRSPALASRVPRQRQTFRYGFGEGAVGLTVITEPSPVRQKSPSQLRVADILAEQFPPASVNDVPLLNQGTVLTERFIEKLSSFGDVSEEDVRLPVFHESALASFFNDED